jgi:hypothetical protein
MISKHVLASLTVLCCARVAFAEPRFAAPPRSGPLLVEEERDPSRYDSPPGSFATQPSSLRVAVGPVLRVARPVTDGGLCLAVDIGSRAAGARAFASWVGAGADHGLAEYAGELWLDFGVGRALHPVLVAGAGVARLDRVDESGKTRGSTLGVGIYAAASTMCSRCQGRTRALGSM